MTEAAVLLGRLLLAGMLALAAATKLRDPAGSRKAVGEFGVPPALTAAAALALPVAELALALLLVPAATASAAAAGAAALFVVFAGAIGVQLARGRRPDCHCFGQLHSTPIGPGVLRRNLGLAALGGLVALAPGGQPEPFAWTGTFAGAELAAALAIVIAVLGLALSALFATRLLRRHGQLLLRVEALEGRLDEEGIELGSLEPRAGLPDGAPAPDLELAGGGGETVRISELLDGRPLMLVFTDRGCGPCRSLMPRVAGWQREHRHELRVAVISIGEPGTAAAERDQHGLDPVLEDPGASAYSAYRVAGTPSAVLIDRGGLVAGPARSGAEGVETVLGEGLDLDAEDEGLPIGAPAPQLRLPRLGGGEMDLAALRGEGVAILFWDPACGFCQGMREDLRRLEDGSRRLLVVSAGGSQATGAERFNCPVALDPELKAGEAFETSGAPIAVLVDAEGRIGSAPAVGPDAVLRLIEVEPELSVARHGGR